MRQRSISKIFFKLPYQLNEAERKAQILYLIPFGLGFNFIFAYIWFELLMGFNFIPFFIILCLIIIGVTSVLYFWDKLDKKYRMRPVRSPFQLSYQGYVIILLCWAPAFFFGMLMLGIMSGNVFFGLGGAIGVTYPIFVMFLRIKTFSDDSMIFSKSKVVLPEKVGSPDGRTLSSGIPIKSVLPDIKGSFSGKREVTETVKGFGFMPISYWIMAEALGIYTIGKGFSSINSYLIKGTPSLEFIIASITIGLLIQTIYLFPDKLNKIVPIELRTKNGFLFMFALTFILFEVSQFLIDIVMALTS